MKVLVLENGVFEQREIKNTLEALQKVVGGWIEIPYLSHKFAEEGIDVIINEEGKLIGLEPQIAVCNKGSFELLDLVVGNVLFASHDEEGNTIGLTETQINTIKRELRYETLTRFGVLKMLFI